MPPSVPTPDDKLYASGTSHETPLPSAPIQGREAAIGVAVAYTLQPDGAVRCDWDMDANAALPGKIANYLFPCAPPRFAPGFGFFSGSWVLQWQKGLMTLGWDLVMRGTLLAALAGCLSPCAGPAWSQFGFDLGLRVWVRLTGTHARRQNRSPLFVVTSHLC